MSDVIEPDWIYETDVAGLVVWAYPRRTVHVGWAKVPRRCRTYSLTHEASGYGVMAGVDGYARHRCTLAESLHDAAVLGDIHWKGKPWDWTKPIDAVKANERVRRCLWVVSGFRLVLDEYDKETKAWAERNGIDLSWKKAA